MKLSVVTPTHKGIYLNELYDSLKDQTYDNWEWLLYLNGGLRKDDLSSEIVNDPRVVIHHDIKCPLSTNVVYLKKLMLIGEWNIPYYLIIHLNFHYLNVSLNLNCSLATIKF